MVKVLSSDDPHDVVVAADDAEVSQAHRREERVGSRGAALLAHRQWRLVHVRTEVQEQPRSGGVAGRAGSRANFRKLCQRSEALVDAVHDLPLDLELLNGFVGAPGVPLPEPLALVKGLHLVLKRRLKFLSLLNLKVLSMIVISFVVIWHSWDDGWVKIRGWVRVGDSLDDWVRGWCGAVGVRGGEAYLGEEGSISAAEGPSVQHDDDL